MSRGLQHVLAITAFGILCLSSVSWVLSYQIADRDTADDVELARRCVDLGDCPARGSDNGAPALGIHNGALWNRVLAHFLKSGSGLQGIQTTFLALFLASAALLYLLLRHCVSPPAALLALLLYLQPTAAVVRLHVLTKTVLLPLPLMLYYAGVVVGVESGSLLATAIASAFLAILISGELACAVMVPLHLGLIALFARRPLAAVLLGSIVLGATFTLESFDVAAEIAAAVVRLPIIIWVLAAVVILVSIGPLRPRLRQELEQLRTRLAALPAPGRWRVVMKAAIVWVTVSVWVGCWLVQGRGPQEQYNAVLVFPFLFLVADATHQLSRRALTLLSALALLALLLFPFAPFGGWLTGACLQLLSLLTALAILAWVARWLTPLRRWLGSDPYSPAPAGITYLAVSLVLLASTPDMLLLPRQRQSWPAAAAENLANGLYRSGYTFQQVIGSVDEQSFGVFGSVDYMLSALEPNLFAEPQPAVATGWSLLPLMVEPSMVSKTQGVVLSFPINRSHSAVVVRAPTYLDRARARVCAVVCGGEPQAEDCTERLPQRPLRHRSPYFELTRGEESVPLSDAKPCLVILVPLRTSGSGEAHIVRVTEGWPLQSQIRRVIGVDFDGQLPAPEVRLLDEHATTGTMEVEVKRIGPDIDRWNLLRLIEVRSANEHLLEPFRAGRASSW